MVEPSRARRHATRLLSRRTVLLLAAVGAGLGIACGMWLAAWAQDRGFRALGGLLLVLNAALLLLVRLLAGGRPAGRRLRR